MTRIAGRSTPRLTGQGLVSVQYHTTSTLHVVVASSGPDDESLLGLRTLCGQQIASLETWHEYPRPIVTCRNCARAVAMARIREEQA